ncbi:MAG: hypothetical protein ACR2HP_05430 [Ilumatobacteraceae bacterium]
MSAVVPLPTADDVRSDVQRMVDFGPRLTGYPGHDSFCTWVEDEMRAAGLRIGPYDIYDYDCYRTGEFSLKILDGSSPGPIDVATTYVRSIGTGPGGVTGPLVLAEGFPTTNVVEALVDPNAASTAVRQWVASVPEGAYRGSIMVVELSAPGALTADVFTPRSRRTSSGTGARWTIGRSSTTPAPGWVRGWTCPISSLSACSAWCSRLAPRRRRCAGTTRPTSPAPSRFRRWSSTVTPVPRCAPPPSTDRRRSCDSM